jgi:predicted RNase H-like HicB family nuclease
MAGAAKTALHETHFGSSFFSMKVEIEQEADGRWIAEIPSLPGAMAYGLSKREAISKAEALVLRILADKLEHGESVPQIDEVFSIAV